MKSVEDSHRKQLSSFSQEKAASEAQKKFLSTALDRLDIEELQIEQQSYKEKSEGNRNINSNDQS